VISAKLLPASIVAATATLALGFAQQRLWPWMAAVLLVGPGWLAELWLSRRTPGHYRQRKGGAPGPCKPRGRAWLASAGFFLFASAASIGLLLGIGRGWALAGLVAALSAWDLAGFLSRLECADRAGQAGDLERSHLRRLMVVVVAGSALAVLALSVRLSLGFGLVLLLASLGTLALGRVIHLLSHRAG